MRARFRPDDFNTLYAKYFDHLIASGTVVADPSGWAKTETEVVLPLPTNSNTGSLAHYLVDNRRLISEQKEALVAMVSAWDRASYQYDQITVVPSISTACLAVLLLIQAQGVKTVYFETPTYYSTIAQAEAIGLKTVLIPTHSADDYAIPHHSISRLRRMAVWLTQPRYVLGRNQKTEDVLALLNLGKEHTFIVVDETADQSWPSTLSGLDVSDERLIRIRGFMKPLGLNALRLALILHATRWRPQLQELQWLVGAALDRQSLDTAAHLASQPGLFPALLGSARQRVAAMRQRLFSTTDNGRITLSAMENGYLGTALLHWPDAEQYGARRKRLLERCRDLKMPITIGSSMFFAHDPTLEQVRLNYFMPARDLEYCLIALSEFVRSEAGSAAL
jgi:DNA-binding transcriptional MocR family regulator